jgi:hypothetical protein
LTEGVHLPKLSLLRQGENFVIERIFMMKIHLISANVTATAGTYSNTTGHLFINTSIDTGNVGSDMLKASSAPPCTPGQTLASWTVPVHNTKGFRVVGYFFALIYE